MTAPISFALNHMAAPQLDCRAFIDLAAGLGCIGVELRNDLADKKLSSADFFDGEPPKAIGDYASHKGLRLLGLSEAYGFNAWTDAMRAKIQMLVNQAKESGAESISLIPRNDAPKLTDAERATALKEALTEVLPMVKSAGLVALVEPLGFLSSSLRHKAEAVEAIEAVGGRGHFKLVHDTFHHHLAGETAYFPEYTGIVHISGVVDPALKTAEMQDGHRILVDVDDRLGNIDQIRALADRGYSGAFSYEPFSAEVHSLPDPAKSLRASMDYIRGAMAV